MSENEKNEINEKEENTVINANVRSGSDDQVEPNGQSDITEEQTEKSYSNKRQSVKLPMLAVVLMLCVAILMSVMITSFVGFVSLDRQRAEFESVYQAQKEEYEQIISNLVGIGDENTEDFYSKFKTFAELFDSLYYYSDEISEEEKLDYLMKYYVYAVGDRFGEYYNAEEYAQLLSTTAGDMVGIGVTVVYDSDTATIEIVHVNEGSPAKEVGIKVGDVIAGVTVDGKKYSVEVDGYDAIAANIRGEEGTSAILTLYRNGNKSDEYEVSVVRRHVQTQSVFYKICDTDKNVGIVKISGFDLTTPAQFKKAVDDLVSRGIDDIVFDLRGNPGGDGASIRAILSYFLDEGDTIMYTVGKDGKSQKLLVAPVTYDPNSAYSSCNVSMSDIGKYKGLNTAVIVNEKTASAAELFTAAFRDYDIGAVVGETTYGKGCMQSIINLSAFGLEGGLRVTTKLYNPSNNESYDGIGITPDFGAECELTGEAADMNLYKLFLYNNDIDNQLQTAISKLNSASE